MYYTIHTTMKPIDITVGVITVAWAIAIVVGLTALN